MKINLNNGFTEMYRAFSQFWEKTFPHFAKCFRSGRPKAVHVGRTLTPWIAAALVCGILWHLFSHRSLDDYRAQRSATEHRIQTATIDVQRNINYALSTLALLVNEMERRSPRPADHVALLKLIWSNVGITALQLAPGGIVAFSYPESYALLSGRNLIEDGYYDPKTTRGARIVVTDQAEASLLLGIQPISAAAKTGTSPFWGFATVVYNTRDLISNTNLRFLPREGYDFRVQYGRAHAWRDLISTSQFEIDDFNSGVVDLPDGDFIRLAIFPKSGWLSPRLSPYDFGAIASATVLAYLLVSSLQRSRRAMQQRIEEASAKLRQMNLQLSNEKFKRRRASQVTWTWATRTRLLLHDVKDAIRNTEESDTLLEMTADSVVKQGHFESGVVIQYEKNNQARLVANTGESEFVGDVRRNVEDFARCTRATVTRGPNAGAIAIKCGSDGCPRNGFCDLAGCVLVIFGTYPVPAAGMWVAARSCEQLNQHAFGMLGQLSHQVSLAISSYEQIKRRRQAEEQIAVLASYDALTGVLTRDLFRKHLERRLYEANAKGVQLAVMLVDLDRFSWVNEAFGQNIGDEALRQVSNRLCAAVRHTDVVARLDGDEFALLISDIPDLNACTQIAQQVVQTISSSMSVCDRDMFVSASIGISIYPKDGKDADTLMTHAECAMHNAIDDGGNRYAYYSKEMSAGTLERVRMEGRLRSAAEHEEFVLHYQPIVNRNNAIVGAEALLRWQPRNEPLRYPGEFIGILEESRLIVPVGEWIIRAVCLQHAQWSTRGYGHLRLSFNVSAQQFNDPRLVDTVARCVEDSGCDPSMLEMELTERVLFESSPDVIDTMNRLKALGVRLSIDDFGVGYSTMTYLTRFPFDTLKIDMSFVHGVPHEPRAKAVVSGVIGMAHGMAMEVVAEGVETTGQIDFLASKKCDLLQGFYFGKPVADVEFDKMLRSSDAASGADDRPRLRVIANSVQ